LKRGDTILSQRMKVEIDLRLSPHELKEEMCIFIGVNFSELSGALKTVERLSY